MVTPYGRAAVAWSIEGDEVVLDAAVPPGCSAEVEVGAFTAELGGGNHSLRIPLPVAMRVSDVRVS